MLLTGIRANQLSQDDFLCKRPVTAAALRG
jgi:hypothetical protein